MPAVRMLGRRWSFATDDCPILLFVPVVLQGAWAVALLVSWIVIDSHHEECYKGAAYQTVLTALFSTFTVFFLLGCWTIYEGLKGDCFCCQCTARCVLQAACKHTGMSTERTNVSDHAQMNMLRGRRIIFPGSIFETRKRARVPYLLYALSLVLIVEIGFNGNFPSINARP